MKRKLLCILLSVTLLLSCVPGAALAAQPEPQAARETTIPEPETEPIPVPQPDESALLDDLPTVELLDLPTETISGYCGGEGDGTNLTWTLTPEGVLTISGEGAMNTFSKYNYVPWYRYRSSLTTLVISEGVTSIGKYAFLNCIALTGSLALPDSLTLIGDQAFYNCSGLTGNLTLPRDLVSIGNHTFRNCSGFTGKIDFPDGLVSIGNYAFYDCKGLNGSLLFPEKLETIGDYAFCELNGFDGSIAFSNNLTSIGKYAFGDCTGLTGSLVLPDSLISIGEHAFRNCSDLTGPLTLSNSLTSIGENAFYHCGFSGALVIPESLTSIGAGAFCMCQGFSGTLTLPEGLTSIEDSAFYACGFIGPLTLPDSLTFIGADAFVGCEGFIGSLTIPENITVISDYAFWGCSGITGSLSLPSGLVSIGDSAFAFCSFTGPLLLPNNLISIGNGAFDSCDGFTGDLFFPDSLETIGERAFFECRGFTDSLILPDSLRSIGKSAFWGCYFSGSLTLPDGLEYIGETAFRDCYRFTGSLSIPESVTAIGDGAFELCFCLTGSLTLPDKLNSIGNEVFRSCRFTGVLTLPNSLTSIGNYAFSGCNFTGTLILPDTLTSIGDYAFSGCGFTGSVTIPGSLASIGKCAFSRCEGLTDAYFLGDAPVVSAATDSYPSFLHDTTLYYIEGTSGWTDSDAYDAEAGTWNGYKLATWDGYMEMAGGVCGDSLRWTLKENGTLYISGTGDMYDYWSGSSALASGELPPWYACIDQIKAIEIEKGVTGIGANAFQYCTQLRSVTFSDTVTRIGDYAFWDCGLYMAFYFEGDAPELGENGLGLYKSGHTVYYKRTSSGWTNPWHQMTAKPYYTTFQYKSEAASGNATWQCDYDDGWFAGSAYSYNHALAKTSLAMAMAAYNAYAASSDYSKADRNIKALYQALGFEKYKAYNYDVKPEADSIAAAFASKPMSDSSGNYTLVSVAVRGGNYEKEWASNFTVRYNEYHYGFVSSAAKVQEQLNAYLVEQGITGKVKFWIAGYSRGSAVADIVAMALDNQTDSISADVTWESKDVFAYGFEVPQAWGCAPYQEVSSFYNNIFTIANPVDLVAKVVPDGLGFHTVGRKLLFPNNINQAALNQMQEIVYRAGGKNLTYSVVENQGYYLNQLMDTLTSKILISAEQYASDLQPYVRELFIAGEGLEGIAGMFGEIWDTLRSIDGKIVTLYFLADAEKSLLKYSGITPYIDNSSMTLEYLKTTLYNAILYKYGGAGSVQKRFNLTEEDLDQLCANLAKTVLSAIIRMAEEHYNFWDLLLYGAKGTLKNIVSDVWADLKEIFEQASYVGGGIAMGHFPELCLAWMETIDGIEDYTGGYGSVYRYNCPVDIQAVDADGTVVAEFLDDVPQVYADSGVSAFVDQDGQKIFVMSEQGEYSFKITATGDGTLNASASFYGDSSLERVVNYYDIPIEEHEVLTAVAEVQTETSESVYEIEKSGVLLESSADLSGEEIVSYLVTVSVEGHGTTQGGSIHEIGAFAQVSAEPDEGEDFLGWYDAQDNLLSAEPVYRFSVRADTALTAKFTENNPDITLTGIHAAAQKNGIRVRYVLTNYTTAQTAVMKAVFVKNAAEVYTEEIPIDLIPGENSYDFACTYPADNCIVALLDSETGAYLTEDVWMTVEALDVTEVILSETELECQVGDVFGLTANVMPEDALNRDVVWSSSNPDVAEVSDGFVHVVGSGTAIITAKAGLCEAACLITAAAGVESVSLSDRELSLEIGETAALSANVMPVYASNQNVTWTSSNQAVATVSDDGVVTAVSGGTAYITAITEDGGYAAACKVCVRSPYEIKNVQTSSDYLTVELVNDTACVVMAAAYDENGRQTAAWIMGVEANAGQVYVFFFGETLPENGSLKIFLLEQESFRPLCEAYREKT